MKDNKYGFDVNVIGGELCDGELDVYVNRMIDKHGKDKIDSITITIDGEYVDVKTELININPFDRIRRITGYLTNLKRTNNAKSAEIADRVKHN